MKQEIRRRLTALRQFMQQHEIAAFIVPSTDPHAGEYIPAHWESRKWISGFTGSAGTVVITLDQAGLWTDSRYYLQAEEQLKNTGIQLFKERLSETPSISEWLSTVLSKGCKVGFDGWVNGIDEILSLKKELKFYDLDIVSVPDPFDVIWNDRPSLPSYKPFILPETYAGESCSDKLNRLRNELRHSDNDGILLSALDEIAWILNLRGCDIPCNPLFVSYLMITLNRAILFIQPDKLTTELTDYLSKYGVDIQPYTETVSQLRQYKGKQILLPAGSNYAICQAIPESVKTNIQPSPVRLMKAIKNPVEIAGFHAAMRRDGVAMVRFLKWLEEAVKKGNETELTIDRKLYAFRAEQDKFQGISFNTIAGYQEHGAIVHYEATPETSATLKPEGFLLLDSGAQYLDGTTDITRTIALGPLTEAQRTDYTLVLKGFIALSEAEFPQGTCGTQLDVLARQYMWKQGINYGHGTGHGVGHFLNVHEGPHQIRMNHIGTPLMPGMTVTNEPSIYRTGAYGIRTENTMLIVESRTTEFGSFYRFEPLTLCPIDCIAIRPELLTPDECNWLNQYHQKVYHELSPLLNEEERQWLKEKTKEYGTH